MSPIWDSPQDLIDQIQAKLDARKATHADHEFIDQIKAELEVLKERLRGMPAAERGEGQQTA